MEVGKLLHNLKGILPEFQNKHYDTFEIRIDLMIEDIIRSLEELISNYDKLVKVSIETAFDKQNIDTEFLLRVLLSQNKIEFDDNKKEYVNPQENETFEVNGVMYDREKVYLINDDKLDDYTKQLEYKYNSMVTRIDTITKEFKNIIHNSSIKDLPQYNDLIETLSDNIDMLEFIKNGDTKSDEDTLSLDRLSEFYEIIKESISNLTSHEVLDDSNNSEE